MNESDLYKYALIACLVGFLSLGALVLFIPLSSSSNSSQFIDGEVKEIYPANGGVVLIVQEQAEYSFFVSSELNVTKRELYRFYDVSCDAAQKDDLVQVQHLRRLS